MPRKTTVFRKKQKRQATRRHVKNMKGGFINHHAIHNPLHASFFYTPPNFSIIGALMSYF